MGMSYLLDTVIWVNRLFQEDINGSTRMLQVTILDPKGLYDMEAGDHGTRGKVSRNDAVLDSIMKDEAEDHKKRLAEDVKDERGGMLVMVSASEKLRDDAQRAARKHLKLVRVIELDYQPFSE
ncbi:hypothetical protein SI65_00600 [Aspergillus cristatus]|uniref:Uncharacterized protein n=1 Tax=Aspergillus cristatus TaxID=573508 RepID=A0A1E3BQF1_ASPCR|nr:hypothetical protein SI65_00600 [Aspergillus cristatus]